MLFHIINVITAYRPNKLSKKIKVDTKIKHDLIEKHPFIRSMIDGSLSDIKYAIYLNNLLPIYKSVEMLLLPKEKFNLDIYQSKKISKDLNEYSKLLNVSFDKPSWQFNEEWLNHFFKKSEFLMKADLYIRWLADMYGGQIIKKNIKYNSKYDFINLRGCIAGIRKYIESDLTEDNVKSFINEVNTSYNFHYNLVENIDKLDI